MFEVGRDKTRSVQYPVYNIVRCVYGAGSIPWRLGHSGHRSIAEIHQEMARIVENAFRFSSLP